MCRGRDDAELVGGLGVDIASCSISEDSHPEVASSWACEQVKDEVRAKKSGSKVRGSAGFGATVIAVSSARDLASPQLLLSLIHI